MNKLCAVFVLALASYTFAAVERYPPQPKPQENYDQEGCYLKETNRVYPYDTRVSADDDSCSEYLCSKATGVTQKFTCGKVAIRDGCNVFVDLTQKYPGCCPQEECDATTPAPTTPTTPASTTPASSTTPSSTTTASSTTSSTTPSPAAASAAVPQGSYAYASAKSESGKPPVTKTFAEIFGL